MIKKAKLNGIVFSVDTQKNTIDGEPVQFGDKLHIAILKRFGEISNLEKRIKKYKRRIRESRFELECLERELYQLIE